MLATELWERLGPAGLCRSGTGATGGRSWWQMQELGPAGRPRTRWSSCSQSTTLCDGGGGKQTCGGKALREGRYGIPNNVVVGEPRGDGVGERVKDAIASEHREKRRRHYGVCRQCVVGVANGNGPGGHCYPWGEIEKQNRTRAVSLGSKPQGDCHEKVWGGSRCISLG